MLESSSPNVAMQRWEEAGVALADALQTYLNLSLSLESVCLAEETPRHLAARIDSIIESLHAVFDRQIEEARSTLSRTRNRISTHISHLPEEVLSEIFIHVAFDFSSPGNDYPDDVNEARIVEFYRRLYRLIGVCPAWRNVIISQAKFWSIVPLIYSKDLSLETDCAVELSLERARGTPLHFTAFLSHFEYDYDYDYVISSEYASRIRTINISTGPYAHEAMQRLLGELLFSDSRSHTPLSLSELSLCHEYEPSYYDRLPRTQDCVHYNSSPEDPFNEITNNLSILRIKGAQFNWDKMTFSHHLTELRLQDIMIGHDTSLINFIGALSSATRLRELEFIGVRSFPSQDQIPFPSITLPKLESLLVRDLRFNTLDAILSSITSRSHHLTLFLTARCRHVKFLEFGNVQVRWVNTEALCQLMGSVSVHALLLSDWSESTYGQLSASELTNLLLSMPYLETFWINKWVLNRDHCYALGSRTMFPKLESLCFAQCRIRDKLAFALMISSHSEFVRWVGFGVIGKDDEVLTFQEFAGLGVSNLHYTYEPPVFGEVKWRMWV